jgi:signal peptidase II
VRRLQERWPVTTLTGEPDVVTGDAGSAPSSSTGPKRLAVATGVVALVVLADQLTKWWAVDRLASGPVHVFWRLDFALSFNTGSAFSLFQGATAALVVVAVALVAVLLVMVWRAPTFGRAAILGLILGGALGNLSDRFFRGDHGAVVDFVDVHVWPTFNVADACITVGCILLAVSLLWGPGRR